VKINIDQTKCIGCGACVAVCPECFEMKGSSSKVKNKTCECKSCDLKEVVEACPAEAISIE